MSGLLEHYHDRGHLHEGHEVGRLLLLPGGDAPVLLGLQPEPLAHVPHPVLVPVHLALNLAAPSVSGSPPPPRLIRSPRPAPS